MKKKIIAALLGIVLFSGIISAGVLKVSADPAADTSAEAGADTDEVISTSTESESEAERSENAAEPAESGENEAMEEKTESTENTESQTDEEVSGMKVVLENTLESDVTSVEVSTFSGESYSENLLGDEKTLAVGESCTIGIPEEFQDQELGMYNIRICQSDGTTTDIPCVPLLEQTTGTLYRDNGIILIRVQDERLEAEEDPVSEAEIRQTEAAASEAMADALSEEVK